MHFWHGYRPQDALVYIINRLFSKSLTAFGILLKGSYSAAQKWRNKYSKWWTTLFPFDLSSRLYYATKYQCWLDGQALIWTLDYPESWLGKMQPGTIGLDAGSRRGLIFPLKRGRRLKEKKIIALEPEPKNYLGLLRNISFNKATWVVPSPLPFGTNVAI